MRLFAFLTALLLLASPSVAICGDSMTPPAQSMAAWSTYAPTMTCASGTPTAYTASGRYLTFGKITYVAVSLTVTTLGTCTGMVSLTLPNTSGAGTYIVAGRESAVTGYTLVGAINPSVSYMSIFTYANGNVSVAGYNLSLSGVYQNQ